jgi:hypothetical protein
MDEKKEPTGAPSEAAEPDKEKAPSDFDEMIRRSKEWISKLDEYLGNANSGDDKPPR